VGAGKGRRRITLKLRRAKGKGESAKVRELAKRCVRDWQEVVAEKDGREPSGGLTSFANGYWMVMAGSREMKVYFMKEVSSRKARGRGKS
jgi:hypothetical protein